MIVRTLAPEPARIAAARLLVVGDVMLDRYWFGEVSRISPEAPVPVVKVDRVEARLGGAANVARNVAALRAGVELLSVIGEDEAGTTSRHCCTTRAFRLRCIAMPMSRPP